MPIYEYKCKGCGEREEALQRASDPPLTVCNKCQGDLVKLISSGGFNLKGDGFYKEGYS